VLAAGDFVKLDFGATVDGYHSDMTRTFVLGRAADWQREIYQLVQASQAAGRQACLAGASGSDIDAASRDMITDAGYGPQFSHGLGHGVGLQVHEAPSLARESTSIMVPDMCVTVEPGIYLPGRGGVRIEDSGVIRSDGYQVLTQTSKELCELG
jgi:Xaa-Pro aminopeptidase